MTPMGLMLYRYGHDDPDVDLCGRLLAPGDVFVDGGANVGLFTLVAADRVGAKGKVIAFEPGRVVRLRLIENVALNRLVQVEVIPAALSSKPGEAAFRVFDIVGAGLNHLAPLDGESGGLETVALTTLDAALIPHDRARLALIKLDLEGAEHEALLGAAAILRERRPDLLLEVEPSHLTRMGSSRGRDRGGAAGTRLFAVPHRPARDGRPVSVTRRRSVRARDAPDEALDGGRYSDAAFFHAPGASFPTFWSMLPVRAPLLTGWAAGPSAARLSGLGEAVIVRAALAGLRTVFGKRAAVAKRLRAAYVHDWQSDPFARGAYSYVTVGGREARERLAAPLRSTLFFAGEAAAIGGESATVAGALQSGERAAEQALAARRHRRGGARSVLSGLALNYRKRGTIDDQGGANCRRRCLGAGSAAGSCRSRGPSQPLPAAR